MRLGPPEIVRQLGHIGFGAGALLLPILGPLPVLLLVLAAFFFNLLVLPRLGGSRLWRGADRDAGCAPGMVLYPAAIAFLIVVFWQRLEVAAAVWGLVALGDGMATLVGKSFGRTPLPWNESKSWAGSAAFVVFGTLGAAWPLVFLLENAGSPFLWAAAFAAALFAAFVESQPQRLDDNLRVPLLTALVLLGLLDSQAYWISGFDPAEVLPVFAVGVALNLALGLAARRTGSLDLSGVVAGTLIGALIWASLGWRGFALLVAFFILGSAATRLNYARKLELGLAQEAGGRRGARHAIANAGIPALAAVFAATTPHADLYLAAFAAAFAAALGDTLASEIGQLWGRRTVLITTWRPVPRGTDGGISLEGTAAGFAGAHLLAVLGFAVGLYPPLGIAVVGMAGFAGLLLESVVGATLEQRGWLDNEAVNFLNTLLGALVAAGGVALLGS